jgi:hypothetical protein
MPAHSAAAGTTDCPYEQSPDGLLDAIMQMGNVGPATVMFDLGSGDGKVVLAAAARGAAATGIEFREELVAAAQAEAERRGLSQRASFRRDNFFDVDLSSANLLFLYLLPDMLVELGPVLFARLRPGTVIISHDYPLKDYQEVEEWTADGFSEKKRIAGVTTAYLFKYVVPRNSSLSQGVFGGKKGMKFSVGTASFSLRATYAIDHTVVYTRWFRTAGGEFAGTLHVIGENNTFDKVWLRGAAEAGVPELGYIFSDASSGRALRSGRTVSGTTRYELFALPPKKVPLKLKVTFFIPRNANAPPTTTAEL